MARILHLEILNFRSIRRLTWIPSAGINCLVGPGDSGKSTILDAIDLCLGARRNVAFADTDFHGLDIAEPIRISISVGGLPDALLNLDAYGEFLRCYDDILGEIEDEPKADYETVLTVRLQVGGDLEPIWSLYSQRAEREGLERSLPWKERLALAPARIGSYASTNLSWSRYSVLNRLTEDRADLGAELAKAGREARASFGDKASAPLAATLKIVKEVSDDLGILIGDSALALLDAHAVSIGDGAIALHDEAGVPLRLMGTGSTRLLVAGLQRQAKEASGIALLDEVEFGLEPHRLIRLLDSLGAKAAAPTQQVFMTSHSPVALCELSGNQLCIVRVESGVHRIREAGVSDDVQSTLRADPEAFLARSVLVCEGASEVGLARGLDLYWTGSGEESFRALGGAYVDVGGSHPDRCLNRGTALLRLGYRVMALLDADKEPSDAATTGFVDAGGECLTWRDGRNLEDEIFHSLPDEGVTALLDKACALHGEELVNEHIRSKSEGRHTLQSVRDEGALAFDADLRTLLANAANSKSRSWFKTVTDYQDVGREIVGPHLARAEEGFRGILGRLRAWTHARA